MCCKYEYVLVRWKSGICESHTLATSRLRHQSICFHTLEHLFDRTVCCFAYLHITHVLASVPRAGSGAVSKWVICACDTLVDFGTVWMWLICIFVLLIFPICIFPSSFFMRLTFSFISFSISYLPEYWTRSVSRLEVVGGDQTWV